LKSTLDRLYRIGLWIKGIDGVLEMAGGLFLLVVSQPQLGQLVTFLTQRELTEHVRRQHRVDQPRQDPAAGASGGGADTDGRGPAPWKSSPHRLPPRGAGRMTALACR